MMQYGKDLLYLSERQTFVPYKDRNTIDIYSTV